MSSWNGRRGTLQRVEGTIKGLEQTDICLVSLVPSSPPLEGGLCYSGAMWVLRTCKGPLIGVLLHDLQ